MFKSKMNKGSKKLLHKMTVAAMPLTEHKTTLHLRGKHAKHFHGNKPGQPVAFQGKGQIQNVGFDSYDNTPTADIQLNDVSPVGQQGDQGQNSPQPQRGFKAR